MKNTKPSYLLVHLAVLLAVCVVVLGAFTRLQDAGLGCPDWPTCYGHAVWPQTSEQIAAADEGRLDVELTTAYELSDDEARAILAQIEKASGKRVDATRKVDPTLVGGIVLQVGSLRLDASVLGRLTRLRHELTTRS